MSCRCLHICVHVPLTKELWGVAKMESLSIFNVTETHYLSL